MLEEVGANEEAALWRLLHDGDSTFIQQMIEANKCSFSLKELTALLNKVKL